METSQIVIHGQTIGLYQSSGSGPAVVFIHGNSTSGRTFEPQFDSVFGSSYRCIALDLPGHGRSQPISDPAAVLELQGYAAIVRGVIEALGIEKVVLVGWSLGGHVALEAAGDIPGLAGLVIYGTPPIAFPPAMDQAFLPNPHMGSSFKADLSEAEMDDYVQAFFMPGTNNIPAQFAEDIRLTDGRCRASLISTIRPGGYKDEVEVVATLHVPLAMVLGEHEQLVNASYIQNLSMPTLWRGALQIVPGAGHAAHWEQPAAFNQILLDFCQDCL